MAERAEALGGRVEAGRLPTEAGRCTPSCRSPGLIISVLIADDQALVRAGFAALLEAEDDLEVCGEASDGDEAVGSRARSRPTSSSWTSACR